MTAPFHYVVKGKLIRYIKDGIIDFIEINESIVNENPILARERAFEIYENHINVLLQGVGKSYVSDKEARKDLISFFKPDANNKQDEDFNFRASYGNGIGVFMVIDQPIGAKTFEDKINDEFLIHGIGQIGFLDDPQTLMDGLNHEYWYYEHYSYDTKDYKQTVDFYDYDGEVTDPNEILETPFDWTGYDLPEESTEEEPKDEIRFISTYVELIKAGESNQVELKPTLLYYHDKEGIKSGYRMFVRHIIAKVICSFLNSNGGFLFIGVGDNKEIQGLANDYSLARPEGKDPKDYFSLEVDKLIRDYFKDIASNISGEFITINEVEIFVFRVFPSKNRPIFIQGLNGKEFYVRLTTSCEPYTDIQDITTYCINKWGK
jgi:hypothetical protein